MIIWDPKPVGSTVAYRIDWASDLDGDLIKSYTILVDSGTAIVGDNAALDNVITALISGGTDGGTTVFTNEIETVGGQILQKTITLYVSDGSDPKKPSTATKRLVIDMAYAKCRLAGYQFDITPEELNNALLNLDLMMSEWAVTGRDLGYNEPDVPGSGDLEDPIGIPNAALNGVSWYLALLISPEMGKTLSAEARKAMADADVAIGTMTAVIPQRLLSRTTPLGSGNKPWTVWQPYALGGRSRNRLG